MEEIKRFYVERPAFDRDKALDDIVKKCLDVMYKSSYPPISYEDLCKESKELNRGFEKPEIPVYNLHYLPSKIHSEVLEDFIHAYNVKSDLPGIIEVLKAYFKKPIVSEKSTSFDSPEPMPEEHYKVAVKFLDMANSFYKWNRDEHYVTFNVCNISPCSNRETVEKWYHEHGEPDFKVPEDSYWFDPWAEENEGVDCDTIDFINICE